MARKRANGNSHDKHMAKALDDLAEFEAFQDETLPMLRQMLKEGASAEDIYTRYQAYAAARTVAIIAKEVDSGKALAAIREVLDRTQGKAKERQEVTHKYSQLKETELDSLILSELDGLDDEPAAH